MSRESGKRTRIRFGAVSAEVSLVKASTKPREAQHETRRVLAEPVPVPPGVDAQHDATIEAVTDPFGDPVDVSAAAHEVGKRGGAPVPDAEGEGLPPGLLGPMGDPTWPPVDVADATPEARAERVRRGLEAPDGEVLALTEDELRREPGGDLFDAPEALPPLPAPSAAPDAPDPAPTSPGFFAPTTHERQPAPTYVPPATRVEQGVHLEDGTWVDLTARLAEIDERTKVDGLEVVRTIPASSYASERVRECHYLTGVNPAEFKVLALLWRALRTKSWAAEVRWTKRTAQAHGIILARGTIGSKSDPAHLALLELEWASNLRKPSAKATGPIRAVVSVDEIAAALELVESFAAPAPREDLEDERLAKRTQLLELARADALEAYVPPAEPMPDDLGGDAELAEALALAAAWNREHAPA